MTSEGRKVVEFSWVAAGCLLLLGGVILLAAKGCNGYNERTLLYVKQGYSQLANGVWVKFGEAEPAR